MTKRAFTLIELLVVIAIIAILAAILFPVFAQAKAQAKGTASLNNIKQLTLGKIIYTADYDDTFVPKSYWDRTWVDGQGANIGGVPYTNWAMLLIPYMRNTELYNDPLTSPVPIGSGWRPNLWRSLRVQYGYNYVVLSPMTGNLPASAAAPLRATPATTTSIGRPAEVPMLGGGWQATAIWWYGTHSMTALGIIDPVDCYTIPEWCFGNWGQGDGNWTTITGGRTVEGARTAGNSLRIANQHTMSFTDGHARRLSSGSAAIGTNFGMEVPAADIRVTNPSIYRWNRL